jgi:hypothetical protein
MRKLFIVLTKRRITLVGTILAVILMFFVINDPAIVGASAVKRELPIYCVKRDNKAVSLTFDAPGKWDTQMLIDILGKYNVRPHFLLWALGRKFPSLSGPSTTRPRGHEPFRRPRAFLQALLRPDRQKHHRRQ